MFACTFDMCIKLLHRCTNSDATESFTHPRHNDICGHG